MPLATQQQAEQVLLCCRLYRAEPLVPPVTLQQIERVDTMHADSQCNISQL